jgi:S-adenosylmethionine decarboxylase
MQGTHLCADLHGCTARTADHGDLMRDPTALQSLCTSVVASSGLTPVAERFHAFDGGGGVTGVVLLAESHLAVHTWPEFNAVTVDVYVCNLRSDNSLAADAVLQQVMAAFAPTSASVQKLLRGRDRESPAHQGSATGAG